MPGRNSIILGKRVSEEIGEIREIGGNGGNEDVC